MTKDIPEPSKDISKRTIAILLVIAIIISVTSTFIAVAREPQVKMADEPTDSAEVRVTVLPPPVEVGAQIKVNVVEAE